MKWAGLFLICACGFGLGQWILVREYDRKRCIQQGIALLAHIAGEMEFGQDDSESILESARALGLIPDFPRAEDFQHMTLPDCFTAAEKHYFALHFSHLGHLERKRAMDTLSRLRIWFGELEERQQEKCVQGDRLYRQLGFCGALVIAILIY